MICIFKTVDSPKYHLTHYNDTFREFRSCTRFKNITVSEWIPGKSADISAQCSGKQPKKVDAQWVDVHKIAELIHFGQLCNICQRELMIGPQDHLKVCSGVDHKVSPLVANPTIKKHRGKCEFCRKNCEVSTILTVSGGISGCGRCLSNIVALAERIPLNGTLTYR